VLSGRLAPRSAASAVSPPAMTPAAAMQDSIPDIAMPDTEILHGFSEWHA